MKTALNRLMVLLIGVALVFLSVGCSSSQQEEAVVTATETAHEDHASEGETHAEEEGEGHAEIVTLSDEELKEFDIQLATAGPGKFGIHKDLTGEIVPDPERIAHIVPRFPGIVLEVRKQIGDRVKKDEVLAVIESNESLAPYEVRSLIDGTVIEMHLTRGEMVSDATHAFVVADLSEVWANLNVYQKDLPYIKVGQKATVFGIEKTLQYTGHISYVSPVVDEDTRTATARVVVPNPHRQWRPGMFVNARVVIDEVTTPVAVPVTALETYEDRTVVFVKTPEGFEPRPVKVGRTNDHFAEIVDGLKPGEVYVARNGFTLKAELLKESFGGGHGH